MGFRAFKDFCARQSLCQHRTGKAKAQTAWLGVRSVRSLAVTKCCCPNSLVPEEWARLVSLWPLGSILCPCGGSPQLSSSRDLGSAVSLSTAWPFFPSV